MSNGSMVKLWCIHTPQYLMQPVFESQNHCADQKKPGFCLYEILEKTKLISSNRNHYLWLPEPRRVSLQKYMKKVQGVMGILHVDCGWSLYKYIFVKTQTVRKIGCILCCIQVVPHKFGFLEVKETENSKNRIQATLDHNQKNV